MVLGSDRPSSVEGTAAGKAAPEDEGRPGRGGAEPQSSSLIRSALVFAVRAHARQRRRSDGAAFIEHPLEVAGLLHDAGCSDAVVVAGLLHDVIEKCHVSIAELTWRFGTEVAQLVQTVTEDATVDDYRHRKRMLREQVRTTGGDAALVFAADKVAKVRELPELVRRERSCRDDDELPRRVRDPLGEDDRLRLDHYRRSLRMLQHVAPAHPLVKRLAGDLEYCPTAIRRALAEDVP
jgi:hypothetical protein